MSLGALGLQALIARYSQDVVALYAQDESGAPTEQLVPEAHIMKASINVQAKIFRHPLADGTTIIDHRIVQPIEIELAVVLSNTRRLFREAGISINEPSNDVLRNTYNVLLKFFNAGTLLAIQTRTSYYPNLVLQSIPYQETTDVYNGAVVVINAQETQFAIPTVGIYSPSDPARAVSEDRGELQAAEPTVAQQSVAAAAVDALTGSLAKFFESE